MIDSPGDNSVNEETTGRKRKKQFEHQIGNALRRLGLYRVAKFPYFVLIFVYYRVSDIVTGRFRGRP